MHAHRLGHLGAKKLRQPGRARRLVLRIDAAVGNVLRQVMQQMADIVQECRRDEGRRGAVAAGKGAALQRVVELAHAFPITLVAASPECRVDLHQHRVGHFVSRTVAAPRRSTCSRLRMASPSI